MHTSAMRNDKDDYNNDDYNEDNQNETDNHILK